MEASLLNYFLGGWVGERYINLNAKELLRWGEHSISTLYIIKYEREVLLKLFRLSDVFTICHNLCITVEAAVSGLMLTRIWCANSQCAKSEQSGARKWSSLQRLEVVLVVWSFTVSVWQISSFCGSICWTLDDNWWWKNGMKKESKRMHTLG